MSRISLLVKIFLAIICFSAMALGIAGVWEVIDYDFGLKAVLTLFLVGTTTYVVDSVVFRK